MVAAESHVEVTEGSGKKLRTRKETVGANEVHMEVMHIADPTTVTQIAGVDASSQLKVVEASAATIAGDTTSIDGKITACNTGDVTVSAMPNVTIGALPNEGQQTMANSVSVALASDQTPLAVTAVTPGTAAANLGKAEDDAHSSGDVGVLALGVRNDQSAVAFNVANWDYTPIGTDAYGRVHTLLDPNTTLDHGSNLDIDLVAEQITATSYAATRGVVLVAPETNTGILYIGNADVTDGDTAATDGIPLYPGQNIFIPISNPNKLYAIASVANQKVFWMAV